MAQALLPPLVRRGAKAGTHTERRKHKKAAQVMRQVPEFVRGLINADANGRLEEALAEERHKLRGLSILDSFDIEYHLTQALEIMRTDMALRYYGLK